MYLAPSGELEAHHRVATLGACTVLGLRGRRLTLHSTSKSNRTQRQINTRSMYGYFCLYLVVDDSGFVVEVGEQIAVLQRAKSREASRAQPKGLN